MPEIFDDISGLTFDHEGPLTPEQIAKLLHYRAMGYLVYKGMLGRAVAEYDPKSKSFKKVIRSNASVPVGMQLTQLSNDPGVKIQVPMLESIFGDDLGDIEDVGVTGRETLTGQEYPSNFRHLEVMAGLHRVAGIEEHMQITKQLTGYDMKQMLKNGLDIGIAQVLDAAFHVALRQGVSSNLVREYGVEGTGTAGDYAVPVRTHADMNQEYYVTANGNLTQDPADIGNSSFIQMNTLTQIGAKMDEHFCQMVQVKGGSYYVLPLPVADCATLKTDTDDFMRMRAYAKDLFKNVGSFDQWEPFGWDGVIVFQVRSAAHLANLWKAVDWSSTERVAVTRRGKDIWEITRDDRSDWDAGIETDEVNQAICMGGNAFGYADASGGPRPVTRETTDYGRILGKGFWHYYGIGRCEWKNTKDPNDYINQSSISICYRNSKIS